MNNGREHVANRIRFSNRKKRVGEKEGGQRKKYRKKKWSKRNPGNEEYIIVIRGLRGMIYVVIGRTQIRPETRGHHNWGLTSAHVSFRSKAR